MSFIKNKTDFFNEATFYTAFLHRTEEKHHTIKWHHWKILVFYSSIELQDVVVVSRYYG